jgi:ElaB/YqjD/DUF883 family membrane-anchored ribosome-binding protein
MKKSMVKSVQNAVGKEMSRDLKKAQVLATKEIAKVKREFGKAVKQAEQYVRKNPEKATAIAAGIGATIGAGITALVARHLRKK